MDHIEASAGRKRVAPSRRSVMSALLRPSSDVRRHREHRFLALLLFLMDWGDGVKERDPGSLRGF